MVTAGADAEYCDDPVPLIANGGLSVIVDNPTLVMVTDRIADPATATLPKSNAGGDTVNLIKQSSEFGLKQNGRTFAALLTTTNDVEASGLADELAIGNIGQCVGY